MFLRELLVLGLITSSVSCSSQDGGNAAAGCVSCSSQDAGNTVAGCTPGQSIQCASTSGCIGAQVCKADGSAYDACICSGQPGLGVGGASSNTSTSKATGGSYQGPGTAGTGGAKASGSGGLSSTGTNTLPLSTGGTSSTTTSATTCAPKAMTGYSYPSYVPARRISKSCTEQAIQQYFTECYGAGNCTAFQTGGAQATCGACLAPTELTASAYGPLLKVGPASAFYYETNIAGCEELMGETSCAPKMQVEFLCEYYSCLDACTGATYDAAFKCMDSARSTQCAQQQAAAVCLTSAAGMAACSGSTFQAQFVNVAKVFCM